MVTRFLVMLFIAGSIQCPAQQALMIIKMGNGHKLDMILIPKGSYMMGSNKSAEEIAARYGGKPEVYNDELPQHRVALDSFWMSRYEITKEQFALFVKKTGYKTSADTAGWSYFFNGKVWEKKTGINWNNAGFPQAANHPATYISWYDAQAFCKWLSDKTSYKCTLPTEAQWEYAARGGYKTDYFWGDNPEGGEGYANAADQALKKAFPEKNVFAWSDSFVYTAPVGSFLPNPFGLYDMPVTCGSGARMCMQRMPIVCRNVLLTL